MSKEELPWVECQIKIPDDNAKSICISPGHYVEVKNDNIEMNNGRFIEEKEARALWEMKENISGQVRYVCNTTHEIHDLKEENLRLKKKVEEFKNTNQWAVWNKSIEIREENLHLRKALDVYADEGNYEEGRLVDSPSSFDHLKGSNCKPWLIAQEALKDKKDD